MVTKTKLQKDADVRRVHYLLNFSRETDFGAVLQFIRSISGIAARHRMGGFPTVVFEVEADPTGIRHHLAVPFYLADTVVPQLRGLIPGANAVKQDKREYEPWDKAVQVRMTSMDVPLRITSPEGVIRSILSAFMPLKPGESILMQWVVSPASPEAPVPGDKQQNLKQADQTYAAVGRIAARAMSDIETMALIKRVYSRFSSIEGFGISFRMRQMPIGQVNSALHERRSWVFQKPCLFNATELATLIAFPAGNPGVPGLPGGMARPLPADPIIPETGILIGTSNYPGAERPVAVSPKSLLRHLWVSGPSGVGKSTLLHNLAVQIINAGYGLMLLEPKGDLVYDVGNSITGSRIEDVILFDPSDTSHPIGLNILADTEPERITGHVVELFRSIYHESWGPRLEYILRYAVLTAALNKLSLYDVKQLLTNQSFRRGVVRKTRNPDVREFWQRYEGIADNAADSVINKLDSFLGYTSIRNILGQTHSGFSIKEVLEKDKILLVPLQSGLVGDSNSSMLGSLIMSLAWQAARGRAGIPREQRKPFFILIDEFQNYLNLPVAIGDALAQARGYGIGMVLANQHTAQLTREVKAAVLANAQNKVVYRTGPDDAKGLAAEFAPYLDSNDLASLGSYEAVGRFLVGDSLSPPATLSMPPAPRASNSIYSVRAASRASYGRPVHEVEAELVERHKSLSEEIRKPNIGRVQDS